MKIVYFFVLLSLISSVYAQDYDIYGNYTGDTLTIEFRPEINYQNQQQLEQNRVNDYYVPDVNISGQIVSSIQSSSNSLQKRINEINADYINFGDNFSQFMTQVGAELSGTLQSEFVNSVLSSTGRVGVNQIVPVVPYLDDMPIVELSGLSDSNGKLNKARLQASKYFDKLYKRCQMESCNAAAVLGLQRGVNRLLGQAIENGKNASILNSWGEDISAYESSLDNINEVLGKPTLEDVLEAALEQERLKEQLQQFYNEWGIGWSDVGSTGSLSEVEQLADNVFELKKCIALGNCNIAPMTVGGNYQNVKKQFNSLLKTQQRISNFQGNALYKNAANDFLGRSSHSLVFGDLVNSKKLEEASNALIDIGLGLIPGVSVGKDLYELISGKSLVTGEDLGLFDRALSGVGILTLGGGNYVRAGAKTLGKLAPLARGGLDKVIDLAAGAIHTSKGLIAEIGANQFTKIMRMPRGQRPDPSSYLKQRYINEHLNHFKEGASRIVSKKNYDSYGGFQRDGTAFVLTKSEADKIIADAAGDKRALESALGLQPGVLDNDGLVRIDIDSPDKLNIRIPSGNEAGTNPLWIPGGKLPNGKLEAVIDLEGAPTGLLKISELN